MVGVLLDAGVTREFHVVRDNRINQNVHRERKPPIRSSETVPTKKSLISNVSEKSSTGTSKNLKPQVGCDLSQSLNVLVDSHPKQVKDASSSGSDRHDMSGGRRPLVSNVPPPRQTTKAHDSQSSPNNMVVGVYSSSSDPVHVPSLASQPAANVGAIKREVGRVGIRCHNSEKSVKQSSMQGRSRPNSQLGRDGSSRETFGSFPATSKNDQPTHSSVSESSMPSISVGKSFLNNQYSSRPNHQTMAHQKAPQSNKEWKPKSSQKPSVIGPGVIGTPTKSASSPANNSSNLAAEAAQLQDKLSHANILDDRNVIIAAHIRVSESDRCRLNFGSMGTEVESSRSSGFQEVRHVEESYVEPLPSSTVSAPESSSSEPAGIKQIEPINELVRSSGSISPASATGSELQLADRRESPSLHNMDNCTNIELVQECSPTHALSEPQQQQQEEEEENRELPSFSTYDPQTGYDMQYFTPAVDESLGGQAFSSHVTNSMPATTTPMVQQQAPVAHMYPQFHLSHFANLMPYRQFLSPVYVPPMAGFSNNPTCSPHPSSGSSYLLMPGASSPHLTANGLKYGIQQYKSVPTGSVTGFGNFTSPGVVGSSSGLDDSSRLKYKDGNFYVPNPQAETSEHWMNPRDVPRLQSASYYNMPGQTPHAAYMPSHTGHASFNAAAHSSHMQFPGLYHPPQPAAIANPHHMGPTMGGNVGVGVAAAAPGAQGGAYQQPQLGQLNWRGNF